MIEAKDISLIIKGKKILYTSSVSITRGKFIAILGPNGAGKSTLLQILGGKLSPSSGNVLYQQKDIRNYSSLELAKIRAYMHQQNSVSAGFTVHDILDMGRMPHQNPKTKRENEELIQRIAQQFELNHNLTNLYEQLSGGEQQRVQFARNILQIIDLEHNDFSNHLLLLDEPLNNLDLKHQFKLLQEARNTVVNQGGTVIAVLHDMNVANQFADEIILMKNGKIIIHDETRFAMEEAILSSLFEIRIQRFTLDQGGVFFHSGGNVKKIEVCFTKPEFESQINNK
jgi:iron complex transport system ATP-binding protein